MQTKSLKYSALAIGMALPVFAGAQALEQARVVSSTPIVQQFSVPQQVCSKVQVFVPTPNTGAGALAGAIVGGAIGNSLGHGAGSAAATALGVLGGAIVGDRLEGPQAHAQTLQQCGVQQVSQSVTVYQVVYEYAGKQYQVQMPREPGPYVTVQLSPVGATNPANPTNSSNAGTTGYAAPAATPPAYGAVYGAVYPQPYYAGPYNGYYGPAYPGYPIGLSLGYYGGRRGHWR
jgi:uncharacterized protein YcfJ